jgi:hypothetical protein
MEDDVVDSFRIVVEDVVSVLVVVVSIVGLATLFQGVETCDGVGDLIPAALSFDLGSSSACHRRERITDAVKLVIL